MNLSIGIDIGGTKVLCGLIDAGDGKVLNTVKKKTHSSNDLCKITCDLINELLELSNVNCSQIYKIGIGAAGQIDRKNGIILSSPNLACSNLNLKKVIEEKYKIPVFLGNDVETATLGEMAYGAGKNYNNFMCVFVGTGVGGGLVINRQLIKGASGTAGEIGHIKVSLNGKKCGCGKYGCLEAYASRTAIENNIRNSIESGKKSCISDYIHDNKKITSNVIKKCVDKQDEVVLDSLEQASGYLSLGLASVVNLINPQCIILGGGLINAVDEFFEMTVNKTKCEAMNIAIKKTEFKKAMLGDCSGIIGASLL
ncbi:MAG: hypothetical protein BHW64_04455 [Candidatus Melainabacteria bacterium LEY3_CP_29_8]|nr:MAG: hypothetical protein BHW64_04455 [Candidatus Melainabacteria bacterium LEY3_CP_29_8]